MPTLLPHQLDDLVRRIYGASIRYTTRNLVLWQLHTMVRPSEAAAAEWAEIDFTEKLWTIPVLRMKKKRQHMWDVIFAVFSTAMFGSWVVYFFKNKRLLLVAPTVLGVTTDWSENFLELLMLKTYSYSGAISEALVSLGSGLNIFKLTMVGLTYLIILVGLILLIKTFITRPKRV